MRIPISPPVVRQLVAGLRAGDAIVLTATIHLVPVDGAFGNGQFDAWLMDGGVAEGGAYCFASPRAGTTGDAGWEMAAIGQPPVDHAACLLLAAGARVFIARGHCPATVSYALRKYQGLYCAVAPDWLEQFGLLPLRRGDAPEPTRPAVLTFPVDQMPLTLTHDAYGRSVAAPSSVRSRYSGG